jgi:Asp/Glu/hydantoin racemase
MPIRIVLIHATPVAIDPILNVLQQEWPRAEPVNILDDSLSTDLESAGSLTPAITRRIVTMARYGSDIGAAAILFTCSAFGRAIDAAKKAVSIPVLKPNEAMFEDALLAGNRLGLLATFGPSVPSMETEFYDLVRRRNSTAGLESLLVQNAMAALAKGDSQSHNRLLAEAAPQLIKCDAIMLAHFSTSRALTDVQRAVACKVLTSPHSAVAKLKKMIV